MKTNAADPRNNDPLTAFLRCPHSSEPTVGCDVRSTGGGGGGGGAFLSSPSCPKEARMPERGSGAWLGREALGQGKKTNPPLGKRGNHSGES